ncbi:MAG TPA: hypothetical protein VHS09_08610, partial [Polyangiaceae bacterium]|nr:hypothetical protein [Polyangiaceae bacterium]
AAATQALLLLPFDAVREAARARSLVLVGLVFSGVLIAGVFVFTVLAANENWDGFMYHEPIVGFAVQNHGFSIVPLQMHQAVQATNGYPHLCEAVSYWLVVFTDKTLIELPNDLGAPAMMLAAYVLARRFGDRVTAMGWACVLFLMPQAWSQLCQTLIDLVVAFFALLAIHFATRSRLRIQDTWCALLGMALLVGSKSSALVMVPPMALVAAIRLVRSPAWRSRRAVAIGTLAGGSVFLTLFGLLAPLRNWNAFHDPLWPVTFENPRLGIHWDGLITLADLGTNKPLPQLAADALDLPQGGMTDVILHGYGYALPWIVIPLGLLATLVGLVAAGLEVVRAREKSDASNLGLVLLLVVAGILTTPTLNGQSARYNLHLAAGLMVAVTWLLAGRPWARLREGVLAASIALSVIPLFWMKGRGWYWVSTEHPEDILLHPLQSRTALERPSFDLLAQKRNAELLPGDWVVFDQNVAFVGALWNFSFSNRVKYVKYDSSAQFVADAEAVSPKWIAVGKDSDARKAVEKTRRWELVGEIYHDGDVVYRRKGSDGPR